MQRFKESKTEFPNIPKGRIRSKDVVDEYIKGSDSAMLKLKTSQELLGDRGYLLKRQKGQDYFKNPVTGKTLKSLGILGTLAAAGGAEAATDLIPGLDQAENAGDPLEDTEMKALRDYSKSQARMHRLKALMNNGKKE